MPCHGCAHLRMSRLSPEMTPVVKVRSKPKAAGHTHNSNTTLAGSCSSQLSVSQLWCVVLLLQHGKHHALQDMQDTGHVGQHLAWNPPASTAHGRWQVQKGAGRVLQEVPLYAYGCQSPGTTGPLSSALLHLCLRAAAVAVGWEHPPL